MQYLCIFCVWIWFYLLHLNACVYEGIGIYWIVVCAVYDTIYICMYGRYAWGIYMILRFYICVYASNSNFLIYEIYMYACMYICKYIYFNAKVHACMYALIIRDVIGCMNDDDDDDDVASRCRTSWLRLLETCASSTPTCWRTGFALGRSSWTTTASVWPATTTTTWLCMRRRSSSMTAGRRRGSYGDDGGGGERRRRRVTIVLMATRLWNRLTFNKSFLWDSNLLIN